MSKEITNEIITKLNSNYNNKLGSEEHNAARDVVEIISLLKEAATSKLPNHYLATQTPARQYCDLESYRVSYEGYSEMIAEVIDFSVQKQEVQTIQNEGIQKAA